MSTPPLKNAGPSRAANTVRTLRCSWHRPSGTGRTPTRPQGFSGALGEQCSLQEQTGWCPREALRSRVMPPHSCRGSRHTRNMTFPLHTQVSGPIAATTQRSSSYDPHRKPRGQRYVIALCSHEYKTWHTTGAWEVPATPQHPQSRQHTRCPEAPYRHVTT